MLRFIRRHYPIPHMVLNPARILYDGDLILQSLPPAPGGELNHTIILSRFEEILPGLNSYYMK